jgi:hypothetical protein
MWLTIRELMGWALTLIGLVMIFILVFLALERQILEAIAVSIPATVVFRSGIGLVRLATAARLASETVNGAKDRF